MKAVLIVALACVASALAIPQYQSLEQARAIIKNRGATVKGLIPALNETIALSPVVTLELNATNLSGVFTLLDGIARNLNTLSDDLELHILRLEVEGNVNITSARLTSGFDILGQITLSTGRHELTGAGQLDVTGTGISAYIYVKLRLTVLLKVQIQTLEVRPSIVACEGSADGARSDGEPVDLNELCVGIGAKLQEQWDAIGASVLLDIVTALNEILITFTLQELIDLIGGGGSN